jgi:hypothetical protein
VEGWALDATDVKENRLREKLANNTKLWIVCLVIFVGATLHYAQQLQKSNAQNTVATVQTGGVAKGTNDDVDHAKLADDMVKMAAKRGMHMTAHFVDVDTFEMSVPMDTAGDELAFMARFSATAIYKRFGNVATVYVYGSKNGKPSSDPMAITSWSDREKNFITKFNRSLAAD